MRETAYDKDIWTALQGKRVLFITTKNLDYLRNTQEIGLLQPICQLTVIGSKEKSYPKRLLHVYRKLFSMSKRQYDAVFVGFAPQLVVPFFGWKWRGKLLYIDFFISLYDTLAFDRKKVKPSSLFGRLLRAIDRKTLQKADGIVADTQAHGQYFIEALGASPQRLRVLYLEADQTIYYPHDVPKPAEAVGKFTVLYFGSILPLQGVGVILQAMALLQNRQDICFYLIGPLPADTPRPEGANFHYISWLSQPELSDYIAFSDLCLAGHFDGTIDKARRTIPGKAYIYHAMQKPMILGDNAATHELYDAADPGISFVPMSDPQALASKIETLAGAFFAKDA